MTFVIFGGLGVIYAIFWSWLFRNTPEESSTIGEEEKKYILENRQETSKVKGTITFSKIIKSRNVWMTMIQYVCSNFTFYFTLTWMFPFVKEKFGLSPVEAENELWRRLILNSAWLWKSKGTRKSIEFIFRFIGAPEGLITLNEYMYVTDGVVDVETFKLLLEKQKLQQIMH